MKRPDLTALTPDDLAALANRGLVKRAQKEIESGDLVAQWTETEDGTIIAVWPDGATCVLPGSKTLKEARCDCAALEMCRHLLRTVLAWQARQTHEDDGTHPVALPWNPARISDAVMEAQVPKATRDRAKLLWSQGVLAEVLCAVKPSARFHFPGHTVRFPVPDDLRYAQCSCSEPAPCAHAVLAVQAFRLLPENQESGIISEGPLDAPVAREPLDSGVSCVREMLHDGLATLSTAWRDRVRRVAMECAEAPLPWPSQILEELADDFDRYTARDASFAPEEALKRAGEFLLRADAIIAGCAPVPQAFIRGLKADRDSELGSSRFVGLGATVEESTTSTAVHVYLQEADTGHIVTVVRAFNEPAGTTRKSFHQLAQSTAVKDASLASLAAGQLVTQGGKRTAAGRLIIGRARAVVNPQNFAWEQLKAPLLVEDFTEITARLRLLPPACFRPRRSGADFHVCPLQGVEFARFDSASNAITAVLVDANGERADLWHPWSSRGQIGAESLLAELQSGSRPLFIAGNVHSAGSRLVIRPTAVVFAGEGSARRLVQPWVHAKPVASAFSHPADASPGNVHGNLYAAATGLGVELLLQGRQRLSQRNWPGWERGIRELEERGCHRVAERLRLVQHNGQQTAPFLKLWRLGIEALSA
jgi:hypothetical protein